MALTRPHFSAPDSSQAVPVVTTNSGSVFRVLVFANMGPMFPYSLCSGGQVALPGSSYQVMPVSLVTTTYITDADIIDGTHSYISLPTAALTAGSTLAFDVIARDTDFGVVPASSVTVALAFHLLSLSLPLPLPSAISPFYVLLPAPGMRCSSQKAQREKHNTAKADIPPCMRAFVTMPFLRCLGGVALTQFPSRWAASVRHVSTSTITTLRSTSARILHRAGGGMSVVVLPTSLSASHG